MHTFGNSTAKKNKNTENKLDEQKCKIKHLSSQTICWRDKWLGVASLMI